VRRRRLLALTLVVPAVAACGNSRTPLPDLTTAATPHGVRSISYPRLGIKFNAPVNWTVASQTAPLVATVTSGAATVAVWRYQRAAPVPATSAALDHTRTALVRAVQARDPSLRLIRSTLGQLQGSPSIVLDAVEQISGHERRVRSIHLFRPGAEFVVDEYAPTNEFSKVDQVVFSPLRRSLTLIPAPAA
jgi:hypothetical protein